MNKHTTAVWLRHTLTFCLMLAVFSTYTMTAAAASDNKSLMGELIVSGHNLTGTKASATINGEQAFSGRTFFSAGTIATPEDASATVKLGKLGFINLSPNSNLSLNFSENKISGTLTAGQIKVFNNEGVEVNIQTPDSLISNEAQQKGIFSVDIQDGTTKAFAENGSSVLLNNGTTVVPVNAPQDSTTASDGNSPLVPLIVLGAIVAGVVIYIAAKDDDNSGAFVSPTR